MDNPFRRFALPTAYRSLTFRGLGCYTYLHDDHNF